MAQLNLGGEYSGDRIAAALKLLDATDQAEWQAPATGL
jgi:hypothetical protein